MVTAQPETVPESLSWPKRLAQALSVIFLLVATAVLARLPQWLSHSEEGVRWSVPRIKAPDEAHEVALEMHLHPQDSALPTGVLRNHGAPLQPGDGLSFLLHNRSEQATYLTVFSINAGNHIAWIYPEVKALDATFSVRLVPETAPQELTRMTIPQDTPPGRMDLVGIFSSEALPLAEVVRLLHDNGFNALRTMPNTIAIDAVQVEVRAAASP